jgi:hypothetical protein
MLGSTFLPSYHLPAPASPQYVSQRRKRLPILKITLSEWSSPEEVCLLAHNNGQPLKTHHSPHTTSLDSIACSMI